MITSVLLGVAVSIGETAPLIMTIFGNQVMNANPFSGPQMALSLLSYKQIKLPIQSQINLGYTSALVLFILVFSIFIMARVLGAQRTKGNGGLIAKIGKLLSRKSTSDVSLIGEDSGHEREEVVPHE